MSYVDLGYGSGGSGVPAVPRSDESGGFGVRVWPHNNTPDLATIYTPSLVYPDNVDLVPLNVGRMFQFAASPTQEIGPDFPMEFATEAEMVNADPLTADPDFHLRTGMKFTGAVKANIKFCLGLSQAPFNAAVALSFHQVMENDDDLVLLKVDTSNQQALGQGSETAPENVPDNYIRSRHVILEVPWRDYAAGEIYYAFWDTESIAGRIVHTYCQAEYWISA